MLDDHVVLWGVQCFCEVEKANFASRLSGVCFGAARHTLDDDANPCARSSRQCIGKEVNRGIARCQPCCGRGTLGI